MTVVLALDPGPVQTGWVVYDEDAHRLLASGVSPCGDLLNQVIGARQAGVQKLALEMIASYGMPVGREVFETCVWIGRFLQAWQGSEADCELIYRVSVKLHLCGTPAAKDSNVRQALLDRFAATGGGSVPQLGTKAKPGPLYGVSTHAWPALGVALARAAGYGYVQGPAHAWAPRNPHLHPKHG